MPSSNPVQEFDSIPDTIAAFKNGEFIIVLDSPSRENEGDLIIAASALTPSKTAFMVRYTSGLICTPMPPSLCDALDLPQMVPLDVSQDPNRTAYTISIDASAPSITTGISAHDRSLTCKTLAQPGVTTAAFRRPGHIFPLRARIGGVRERRGHTEAAVEFCRLAGLPPVGAICELVEDGEAIAHVAEMREPGMMRRDGCLAFGKRWGLRVCTIEDLVDYVEAKEGKLGKVNGIS